MVQKKNLMIPQSIPNLIGKEKKYLNECVESGYIASAGKFLNKFKKKISKVTKAKYVTLTSSGSTALHASLLSLSIKKDEIILLPSFTFIATVNAIKLTGAEPYFIDIKKDTFNIDEDLIEKEIKNNCFKDKKGQIFLKKNKKKISAIMPVFTFGLPAEMKKIRNICNKYNLKLIIDAACAIGAEYKTLKLGQMGADLTVLSFNSNKIITSGGGGAIISNKKNLHKKTELFCSNFKNYENKYIFNEIGFNYRMNNIQAAIGCAQIENLNFFLKQKKYIRDYYNNDLKEEISKKKITELPFKNDRKSSNWLSGFLVNKNYEKIKNYLKSNNIYSEDFWKPCHLQKPYLKSEKSSMRITNEIWKKILILPSSTNLSKKNLDKIIKLIKKFFFKN